jgi:hypothetical protein
VAHDAVHSKLTGRQHMQARYWRFDMDVTIVDLVCCGHCGRPTRQLQTEDRAITGGTTLDFRVSAVPGEAPVHDLVQTCENCGYCAADIAQPVDPAAQACMATADYAERLADRRLPAVVRQLLAAASLYRASGQHDRAARAHLAAAWALDDITGHAEVLPPSSARGLIVRSICPADSPDVLASDCRLAAVDDLRHANAEGQAVHPRPVRDAVMAVDLLRRAGEFEAAIELASRTLPMLDVEDV